MTSQVKKKWIIRIIGWVMIISLGVYKVYYPTKYPATIADFGEFLFVVIAALLLTYKIGSKK
ncbi:hypothetical protein QNH39_25505 [Neobacillus novalis]|uniref:Uncharacterized protein n=1 Tax=Neobacillus novalis TaxID=220687 RepID=A0AA95MSR5_9BACI|nr:hypothetical protein [Neobacillus novalis]WHY85893.1 hypothetical protein QNH39_25505 [Neobacillus novalis]